MMIARITSFFKLVAVISMTVCWVGCIGSTQERDFRKAKQYIAEERHIEALQTLDRVIKRDNRSPMALEATQEAAHIAEIKLNDPRKALQYYHHLVLALDDPKKQLQVQKRLAELYFQKLVDYENAIIEYNKLLDLTESQEERLEYHFQLAKAYFYLNQFFQARVEVEEIEKAGVKGDRLFEALLLKGNIYLASKNTAAAIAVYKSLLEQFPQRAQEEQILLNLALCYEEEKDFKSAIAVLERLKTTYSAPQFIEVRIRKLQERISLQPGAQGLKK